MMERSTADTTDHTKRLVKTHVKAHVMERGNFMSWKLVMGGGILTPSTTIRNVSRILSRSAWDT